MRSLTTLRAAGIAALLATGGAGIASAADMMAPPPPPPPMMQAPPLDVGGGFYLRGDVGTSYYSAGNVHNRPPLASTTTLDSGLDSTAFIGIGAGYQFNSFLRADITADYRFGSKFRVLEQTTGPAPATPAAPGYNLTKGKYSSTVLLANGYVDMGTWHRITPYVGVGLGMAAVTMSGVTDTGFGAFAGGSGRAADQTKYNFAWALHAGATYDLSANLKADVGYRYVNMGTVNSATVVCGVPCTAYHAQIKRLDSHDLRVGLRYVFADMAAPTMYAPPLVRKY